MSRLPLQQFRFKGTPLFGVDSSPHFTSKILGIAGTVFFWLIFLLCMCLIRFKEKEPEFKEVKIILSSTPLQEVEVDTAPALAASAAQSAESAETQASAEAASQPAEQIAVEQPAPAKPVEKPVEKAPPKTEQVQSKPAAQQKPAASTKTATEKSAVTQTNSEPVKKTTEPSKPFVPSGIDLTDGVDFGTKTSSVTKSSVPDWFYDDDFDDDPDTPAQTSSTQNIVATSSSVAGTAGTTTDNAQNHKQESKSSSTNAQQSSASGDTKSKLAGIAEAKFQGQAANGVTSETAVKAKVSGNGQYLMEMKGGSFRCLIKPSEPKIDLSEAACRTVNSNIDVTISFTVTQGGQISEASIIFSPASILSEIVKKEIKETLQTWLFEAASNTSQASFEYHIKKK
ncbi:MAG: hypothetical protein PUC37_11570 [Spirochaetales bacterium]|nr:hypothetical protein [Spirochaetales bacterium]